MLQRELGEAEVDVLAVPVGQPVVATRPQERHSVPDPGLTEALEVAQRLCNPDTGLTSGYSSTRKPVRIHCIAFGSLFNSSNGNTALGFLQSLQTIGGVQANNSIALAPEKIITGTSQQRIDKMQTAFSKIMQDGHSVTLID